MFGWDLWKKGFEAWEGATAQLLEAWLKSPLVLEPSGAMLTQMLKAKALGDKVVAQAWGAMGLPTKRDQERALYKLNQLESKLLDLEERLIERGADGPRTA
jgi:predicted nucleotidyltransferase